MAVLRSATERQASGGRRNSWALCVMSPGLCGAEAEAAPPPGRRRPPRDAGLLVDGAEVLADGPFADPQPRPDLLVRPAVDDEREHLGLTPSGQVVLARQAQPRQ